MTVDVKAKRKLKEIEEFDKNVDEKNKTESNKENTKQEKVVARKEQHKEVEEVKTDFDSKLPPLVKNHDDRIVYPFVGVYLFLKSNVSAIHTTVNDLFHLLFNIILGYLSCVESLVLFLCLIDCVTCY